MEKKTITERVWPDKTFEDCYTLGEIIEVANELIKLYGDAEVTLDAGHNNVTTILNISREETDEEFEYRKIVMGKKKERDRKIYEKLKKEFEQ